MVKIFEAPYKGWNKCLYMENDDVQLVITLEVGPRIIRYAKQGGENMFCEFSEHIGTVGGDEWKNYGGHRLWHSPEAEPRSYPADNFPIKYTIERNTVTLIPDEEDFSRTQKVIIVTLNENGSNVKVEHKITNKNAWPVELAAWGITVTAPGGLEAIPTLQSPVALLPNRRVVLWPYTKMNDSRFYWGDKYITLEHNADIKEPAKIGTDGIPNYAAVFNNDCVFIKHFDRQADGNYPDFGVAFESYICDRMIECETLSPLYKLEPDETVTHIEYWELHKSERPQKDDEEKIAELLKEYI